MRLDLKKAEIKRGILREEDCERVRDDRSNL